MYINIALAMPIGLRDDNGLPHTGDSLSAHDYETWRLSLSLERPDPPAPKACLQHEQDAISSSSALPKVLLKSLSKLRATPAFGRRIARVGSTLGA